jgi:hypothetical protein
MQETAVSSSAVVRNVVHEGCTWTVCERPIPYNRHRHALVFMSERVARRVKRYPSNWFELPDEALAQLSASA